MTIKIEFPSENKILAAAIGAALVSYGTGKVATPMVEHTITKTAGDNSITETTISPANEQAADDAFNSAAFGSDEQALSQAAEEAATSAGNLSPSQSTGHPSQDANGKWLTDHKGVMHIPAVCGDAKVPFYASGTNKGQWKRKVGITEENYNVTYANALNQVVTGVGSISPDSAAGSNAHTQNDQSAEQAFGDQQQQQQNNQQVTYDANATPNTVFEKFTGICQAGDQGLIASATKCFTDAGLANPSLIFSRPDLAVQIFSALAALGA